MEAVVAAGMVCVVLLTTSVLPGEVLLFSIPGVLLFTLLMVGSLLTGCEDAPLFSLSLVTVDEVISGETESELFAEIVLESFIAGVDDP